VRVPCDVDSFFVPFVINTAAGKRFGKYPPGYPLLLALGAAVGQPWLINALAAALGVLGTYLLGWASNPNTEWAVAAALRGAAISGRMPVPVPPAVPLGAGISLPALEARR